MKKSDAKSRLELITLGTACLRLSGGSPPLFGPGKPLALLCYLAFSPRRTASREHLLDFLWADAEPERARHVLRQTLWHIRQTLNQEIILAQSGDLVLSDQVESDRDTFLAAVNRGELDQAVTLYGGEFLPGLAVPGGAAFDQWADVERYRLRAAFVRTGETLVRRQMASGHARDAIPLARRVRDANPINEHGWRLLLETLVAAHDAIGAAMEADALAQLLSAEGREPEPPTRAALRLARQTPDQESHPERGLVAELVGREREFSHIVRAWDEVRRGAGRRLHVVAPAGLGKTRLLSEVQSRLRAGGARVVALRAAPGERHLNGAFIGELAHALAALPGAAGVSPGTAGTLVALHPAISSLYNASADLASGEDALRRRISALAELVAAVASEGPLALILDDLHWADPQSRTVLAGVGGRVSKEPVLILSAARPGDGAPVLPASTDRLPLDPLPESQVRSLLASLGALPDAEWVQMLVPLLHGVAAGSPLLVLETLQLALERQVLELTEEGWRCAEPEELSRQLRAGAALRHRVGGLDRTSTWLLLVLSVAGTPVSTERLARASQRAAEELESLLTQLEVRGLVSRSGGNWEPGHDEIAALAIELAPPAAVRAADKDLGQVFLQDADKDSELLARAGPHLAAAGELGALERAYAAWVKRARRRGDGRGPGELAAELLGGLRNESVVERLVRSLPLRVRLGVDTPGRVAMVTAVVVLLVVGALATALHRSPLPDARLLAVQPGGAEGPTARSVSLYRNSWDSLKAITLGSPRPFPAVAPGGGLGVPRPGTDQWIVARPVPDSGTIDLFLIDPSRSATRLTSTPGDDDGAVVSPDGRYVAFSTARWSPLSHYNLAVLDLVTGKTRRLTHNDATDAAGGWSPDGTRILVARRYWTNRRPALCWVTPDASREHCREVEGDVPTAYGWVDSRRVLVQTGIGSVGTLEVIDVDNDSVRVVATKVISASVSPDGNWIADLERAGGSPPQWWVRPSDALNRPRPVTLEGDASEYRLAWLNPGTPGHYLDRLTVSVPGDTAQVGVPLRLAVQGRDSLGRAVDLPVLQFSSGHSKVAEIDSEGVLTAKAVGEVAVVVSAGGWRTDTVQIPVGSAAVTTLLTDGWEGSLTRFFRPFGLPQPEIVPGPEGRRWFWNAGEGSFTSGVLSQSRWLVGAGLGVEAEISAPVTMDQWQFVALGLTAALDSAALATWNFRDGGLPTIRATDPPMCVTGVPGGEGPIEAHQVALSTEDQSLMLSRPEFLKGGVHRFLVQIFPDGRCGFAIDGRAVYIANSMLPTSERYWLLIHGNSYNTKILVGRVRLWRGVRTDVEWGKVGR